MQSHFKLTHTQLVIKAVMLFCPRLLMMNVSAEPAIASEEPTTRPEKESCRGLIAIIGLALIAFPVSETETSLADPTTPLLVNMLTIED